MVGSLVEEFLPQGSLFGFEFVIFPKDFKDGTFLDGFLSSRLVLCFYILLYIFSFYGTF